MAGFLDLRAQVRILPILGPGKMQLLEAIDRHGSIAAAARAMGMAYPNAWKLVDSLNRHFKEPLVTRSMGGRGGGGAVLTDTGRAVLGIFRSVEAKAKIMFAGDIDALNHLLAPLPPEEVNEDECGNLVMGSENCVKRRKDDVDEDEPQAEAADGVRVTDRPGPGTGRGCGRRSG